MTKAIMNTILSVVSSIDTPEANAIREAINTELARGEAKAQANRDLYAEAHDVVMEVMSTLTAPATIGEIFDEVAPNLPDGMTKSKLQYAITRLWTNEIEKTEGKVNTYSLKA